jgi:hypothetical protein
VTDRAGLARRAADVLGGPQQLGVGVTDIFVADKSSRDLGQEGVTYQSELNDCSIGSAGAKTLIH